MMLKFKNKITKEDFIEYNIYHMNSSKTMKNARLAIRFVFPVMFMLFGIISGNELDIIFWTIMIVGSVGVFMWIPSIMNKTVRKRIGKMISEGDNGEMFMEKDYLIDESGIRMNSNNSSGFYKWDSITKINESENCIFLFVSTVQAVIIPKKIIKEQLDINEFRNYISERVEK